MLLISFYVVIENILFNDIKQVFHLKTMLLSISYECQLNGKKKREEPNALWKVILVYL